MNERQKALYKLQYMDFAIHETVLYLDGHPDNKKALEYYKAAVAERNDFEKKYTEKYGPVKSSAVSGDKWSWIDEPWPWQKEA